MLENINLEFPVTIYGNLEKYNETISKGRCRIFYKGGNRNGTFITDEFAETLLSSIPYTPVKGIFEEDEGDYTDHGAERSQGRIYGIVPENPNIAWEEHEDEDGVTRMYACADVLIFTGLYAEANAIIGKSQSMEIYPPSIKGDWKIINGKKYYVFSAGHFLGLQVLGDMTEPCFEGAAFFSLYNDLKKLVTQIKKYTLNLHEGGKPKMLNYKLSDNEKFNALWCLLNANYCEEADWVVDYDICEVYDEYAVVKNYAESIYERVYYIKNDETDSLEITSRVRCYIMDVSESEKNALDALRSLNNGTYEKVDENYSATQNELSNKAEELSQLTETYNIEKTESDAKIGELNELIATLTTERDEAKAQFAQTQEDLASLNEEASALRAFQAAVEKKEKEAVIAKYSVLLGADILSDYTSKMSEYTAKELDKELAYILVSINQTVFSNQGQGYIPKDEPPATGLEGLLAKYSKK